MAEIVIDLGEDGEILIDTADSNGLIQGDEATEKTGFRDTLRQTGEQVKVNARKVLKLPLTGLAKVLMASLPEPSPSDRYELEQFSVEFNLGIKTEAGTNVGAVAKIMPEGALKCTYTWKRKPNPATPSSTSQTP